MDKIFISMVLTLLSVFVSQFHSRARGMHMPSATSRERDEHILVGGGGGGGGGREGVKRNLTSVWRIGLKSTLTRFT